MKEEVIGNRWYKLTFLLSIISLTVPPVMLRSNKGISVLGEIIPTSRTQLHWGQNNSGQLKRLGNPEDGRWQLGMEELSTIC